MYPGPACSSVSVLAASIPLAATQPSVTKAWHESPRHLAWLHSHASPAWPISPANRAPPCPHLILPSLHQPGSAEQDGTRGLDGLNPVHRSSYRVRPGILLLATGSLSPCPPGFCPALFLLLWAFPSPRQPEDFRPSKEAIIHL